MRLKKIEPTVVIYNSLIRVYANACLIERVTEEARGLMLVDTWKLLEEVIQKGMVDTGILNNVMLVYGNALQEEKIEGLILPLFDKFGLVMDGFSYEILMGVYYRRKDF